MPYHSEQDSCLRRDMLADRKNQKRNYSGHLATAGGSPDLRVECGYTLHPTRLTNGRRLRGDKQRTPQ